MSRGVVKAISQGIVKGITQLRDWVFDPTLLNPYLFVNAQDSPLSPLQAPTLDLDPSVPSSLDIITATRAGTATVTDASGLIQEATANTVRVDHLQGELITAARTNLMGYSEPTLAQYSNVNGGGISEVVIDDSGLTQWTQWDDTTGATRYVNKTPFPFTIGQTYVFSFYLRMNDGGAPVVGNSSTGVSADLAILIEGSSNAGTAGGMESVGSGLYRVWGKRTITTTSGEARIYKYNNQSARGFRFSGLQVEQATAPTALIDNDTGGQITIPAVYGPRVPMILCEPAATNLVPYSVSNSNWSVQGATITENFSTSPEGQQTATKVIKSGNSKNDRTSAENLEIVSGTEYTVSTYLKNIDVADITTIAVRIASGTLFRVQYRWYSGVISSSSGTTYNRFAVDVGDGWYRVGFTFTADGTSAKLEVDVDRGSATYTDTSSILKWGAQLETGSVATSYKPTSGSAVTRAADNLSITGSAFSDFYNQSEGTVYVEATGRGYEDYNTVYSISDGTGGNRIYLRTPTTNSFAIWSGGVNQSGQTLADSAINVLSRVAGSYKVNNIQYSKDGTSATTDTSATIPTGLNQISIGSSTNANFLNGHIKRFIFWHPHSDSL